MNARAELDELEAALAQLRTEIDQALGFSRFVRWLDRQLRRLSHR